MSWVRLIFLSAVLTVFSCHADAAVTPVPIEGQLLVSGTSADETYSYFMEGDSDTIVPTAYWHLGEISPLTTHVGYTLDEGVWPTGPQSVWSARVDGSEPFNISGAAGLGGINCLTRWSPDGRRIAFQHVDVIPGLLPCESGFDAWVVNADGTGAHRLLPDGSPQTVSPVWSPNGYRLACEMDGVGTVTVDLDGTDVRLLPDVGGYPRWSPDGSQIASVREVRGEVEGEVGTLRQLLVTDAVGGEARVLVEHFITDSAAQAHLDRFMPLDPPDYDWIGDVAWWAGPLTPQWSPRGDRIAFVAAMPFEPSGPYYKLQTELWMYDMPTGDLTRVTYDNDYIGWISWNGPNTSPEDPEVTVDNTTVIFSSVAGEGLTTVLRDDDPPDLPGGYQFAGEFYDISTTAPHTSPITICMTYRDEDLPTGANEAELAILHYDDESGVWHDITTSRDAEANLVTGVTDTLSGFVLTGLRRAHFPDVPATGLGPTGTDPFWAFSSIEACVAAGIVAGYPDGLYRPSAPVTRDQMAVYVARVLVQPSGDAAIPDPPATPSFSDVPGDYWAYPQIEYAVSQRVVQGYGDGRYQPTGVVDRGQMAVFAARAMVAPAGDAAVPDPMPPLSFPDVASDFWACKWVEYCAGQGVVKGYDDGNYHPEYQVTRDQMAVYVARAFQLPL